MLRTESKKGRIENKMLVGCYAHIKTNSIFVLAFLLFVDDGCLLSLLVYPLLVIRAFRRPVFGCTSLSLMLYITSGGSGFINPEN